MRTIVILLILASFALGQMLQVDMTTGSYLYDLGSVKKLTHDDSTLHVHLTSGILSYSLSGIKVLTHPDQTVSLTPELQSRQVIPKSYHVEEGVRFRATIHSIDGRLIWNKHGVGPYKAKLPKRLTSGIYILTLKTKFGIHNIKIGGIK